MDNRGIKRTAFSGITLRLGQGEKARFVPYQDFLEKDFLPHKPALLGSEGILAKAKHGNLCVSTFSIL